MDCVVAHLPLHSGGPREVRKLGEYVVDCRLYADEFDTGCLMTGGLGRYR
jgi:hypothetical protein